MLIANIRAEFDASGRLDGAVEAAGKAVFWKDKGVVTRQVRLWDAPGVARVIQRLSQAERATRSGRGTGELLVRHELLTIARQAARER
jgi:DNA polymerase-3 subunit delta